MLRSSMAKHSLQGCCSQPNHASWGSSLCLQLLWAQEPQTHFSVSAQRIKQKEMHLSQEVPPHFSAPYRKILVPGTVLYRCPVTLLRGNSTSNWEGIPELKKRVESAWTRWDLCRPTLSPAKEASVRSDREGQAFGCRAGGLHSLAGGRGTRPSGSHQGWYQCRPAWRPEERSDAT